jgi:acyl-phosphate glycerol 3-phosphate acyltransferase
MGTTVLLCFLPIVIGYFLGSVLPGYLLPLWMKNVDIRTLGDGNPGTINVKRSIGLSLALVIAAYDLTKGLLAMFIAYRIFKAPGYVVDLSGFAAILGHKFPFYLKFRGGRGIATTVGIFIFLLAEVTAESVPTHDVIAALCYMGTYAILMMAATHDDDFLAVTLLPIAGGILAFYVRSFSELTLVITLIGMISYEGSKNLRRKMFVLAKDGRTLWRIFARSLAMLVIFLGLFISKEAVLLVVGSLLFLFFAIDVLRMTIPRLETVLHGEVLKDVKLLQEQEKGTISSYTIFLLGVFLSPVVPSTCHLCNTRFLVHRRHDCKNCRYKLWEDTPFQEEQDHASGIAGLSWCMSQCCVFPVDSEHLASLDRPYRGLRCHACRDVSFTA